MLKSIQSRVSMQFSRVQGRGSSSLNSTTSRRLQSKASYRSANANNHLPAGHRSSSSLPGQTSFYETANNNLEYARLEHFIQRVDFFQILLHLLPTEQHERRLRLTLALIDFSLETDATKLVSKARKIACTFFHSGSRMEVTNIPSHLAKAKLEETCDTLIRLELGELVKLPEVIAALDALDVSRQHASSSNSGGHEGEDSPATAVAVLTSTSLLDDEVEECDSGLDLALMSRLEKMIQNSDLRRKLIQNMIESGAQRGLSLKVRFVAVVDQFSRCEVEEEKTRLGKKIVTIFLETGSMFAIHLPHELRRMIVLQGNLSKLEDARVEVLTELCNHSYVVDLVAKLENAI